MVASNIYSEYATLDAEIAALELKKSQLRPHIVKMMVEQGLKNIDIGVGKFSVSPRKVWSYPESVATLEEEIQEKMTVLADQVKTAKAKAESTGEATCEEVPQLRYTAAKL